jgi:Cu(I)/Ag(I) efflux system periplasmic protein CusF
MKFVLPLLAALALSAPAMAQDHGAHASGHAAPAAAPAKTVEGVGVVKSINPKAGTITIAHEPIKALSWGSMVMPFKVSDPAFLKTAKVGSKVRFQLKGQQIVGLTVL